MVQRRGVSLSADVIVAAALRVARAEGIDAVSMRRLADELGISAMSPYRHVSDRQDLLLRMLDVVADGLGPVPTTGTPRERIAELVIAMHDVFRRDPWVVQVLATQGLASPLVLPLMDALFGALAETGLEPPQARQVCSLLIQFTFGEVLFTHHDDGLTYGRQMIRTADPDRYPHLAAIAGDPAPSREFFLSNLDRVLDGSLGPA